MTSDCDWERAETETEDSVTERGLRAWLAVAIVGIALCGTALGGLAALLVLWALGT